MSNENSGPVFNLNNYGAGPVAQGMNVTQNVGASRADLVGLVVQLRGMASQLGPQQEQFTEDIEVLEDTSAATTERTGAWQRIKAALGPAIGQVAAAGIISAGEQIVSSLG